MHSPAKKVLSPRRRYMKESWQKDDLQKVLGCSNHVNQVKMRDIVSFFAGMCFVVFWIGFVNGPPIFQETAEEKIKWHVSSSSLRAPTGGHLPRRQVAHTVPEDLSYGPLLGKGWKKTDHAILKPLYSCHNSQTQIPGLSGRDTKLVFVHIFKTAGSTMRGLFQEYARKCNAGYQTTIGCTYVNYTSTQHPDTPWMHDSNDPCQQKRGVTRDKKDLKVSKTFNGKFLEENIDILGGHMPLGIADYTWTQYKDVRYISFFRDALSKFVSARMYNMEHLSLQEHVTRITEEVKTEVPKGNYFQGYFKYLLTPQQKEVLKKEHRKLSVVEMVHLVQQNILQYKIIVGITERMPQSLEMLHFLLDSEDEARDFFESWGMPSANGTKTTQKVKNKQKTASTSDVIAEISKNKTALAQLKEYVKYEQQITDFAIKIHEQQYQSIQK